MRRRRSNSFSSTSETADTTMAGSITPKSTTILARTKRKRETRTVSSSVWEKPLWLLVVLLVLLHLVVNVVVVVVDAKCVVRDAYESKVPLYPESMPSGIQYNAVSDTLVCLLDHSCWGYRLIGCTSIYCRGHQSCQDTEMTGNGAVACWGSEACLNAYISKGKTVACGAGYGGSCIDATIETSASVLCYGDFACVTQTQGGSLLPNTTTVTAMDRGGISLHVGQGGHVVCSTSTAQLACQDLLIHVPDVSRACYGPDTAESNPHVTECAIICTSEEACDKSRIQFIHD